MADIAKFRRDMFNAEAGLYAPPISDTQEGQRFQMTQEGRRFPIPVSPTTQEGQRFQMTQEGRRFPLPDRNAEPATGFWGASYSDPNQPAIIEEPGGGRQSNVTGATTGWLKNAFGMASGSNNAVPPVATNSLRDMMGADTAALLAKQTPAATPVAVRSPLVATPLVASAPAAPAAPEPTPQEYSANRARFITQGTPAGSGYTRDETTGAVIAFDPQGTYRTGMRGGSNSFGVMSSAAPGYDERAAFLAEQAKGNQTQVRDTYNPLSEIDVRNRLQRQGPLLLASELAQKDKEGLNPLERATQTQLALNKAKFETDSLSAREALKGTQGLQAEQMKIDANAAKTAAEAAQAAGMGKYYGGRNALEEQQLKNEGLAKVAALKAEADQAKAAKPGKAAKPPPIDPILASAADFDNQSKWFASQAETPGIDPALQAEYLASARLYREKAKATPAKKA